MVRFSLIAFVTALAAGPALAESPVVPATTSVCLDVNGSLLPVVCHVQGSRLDRRDTICQCPEGARTDASVCAPGERPPVETVISVGLPRAEVNRLRDQASEWHR